jgi:hypothetical protein
MCQRPSEHLDGLFSVPEAAAVLSTGELSEIPVQIFHQEAEVNAPIGPLHAREGVLDLVRRDTLSMLVSHLMFHPGEFAETNEFIIGGMLVCESRCVRSDMLPNHVPGTAGVLASGDHRDEPAALPMFADGHYDHPVPRLVLRKATVDPFLLPVLWPDMSEGVKPVDLDLAVKHGVIPPGR